MHSSRSLLASAGPPQSVQSCTPHVIPPVYLRLNPLRSALPSQPMIA
jgi:hypothetical protein